MHKIITLTKNQVTLVDEEDFEWLSQWKWCAMWQDGAFYAVRNQPRHHYARGPLIRMHRQILGLEPGDPRIGDHIHCEDTLDNRRSNLRIADPSQSSANRRITSRNKCRLKGASWNRMTGKWMSRICWRGVVQVLGYFDTAEEAHAAYRAAVKQVHGEFARPA